MKIQSCNLENFRNIEGARLRFESDRVFFVGSNGQGKSNLLEGLGLLQAVRSFRTSDLRNLIRREQKQTGLFFELETAAPNLETVLLKLNRSEGRSVEVNGELCPTLGDFLSRFPAIVLATDDIQIIRGAPALRRRVLDLHFASSRAGYYENLRIFTRGLAARNRLLKKGATDSEIHAHDHPLAQAAATLISHRIEGSARITPLFSTVFEKISGGLDNPNLRLKSSSSDEISADAIREKWKLNLAKDRFLGSTQSGPHRDDWVFSTDSVTARDFASDGQQRNLAIAFKLALFQDLNEILPETPVLLIDDILGELDSKRRRAFWETLPPDCQVFATGTEFDPGRHPGDWQVFEVVAGKFVEKSVS